MLFVQMHRLTRMDQRPIPVIVIQTAAGMTELIGQTKIVLEWGQRLAPVTAIQTAAGFD